MAMIDYRLTGRIAGYPSVMCPRWRAEPGQIRYDQRRWGTVL